MSTSTSGIRTRWAAVGAAVAITLGAAGIGGLNIANADVSSGDRPVFISINPCRLVDTRPDDLTVGPRSIPIGAEETITVTAHGSNGECTGASAIPTDALSLSLNVTAVGPTSNTFLTFWGDGPNPGTSNLNPRAGGAPTPNSVNTPLSTSGTFNIFNNRGDVNVIVDVNGYYANHNHDDRYEVISSKVTASPPDFEEVDETATEWSVERTLIHRSSTGSECAVASIDIPAGQQVTGAELVYEAIVDNDAVDVTIHGLTSEAGSPPFGDVLQEIAGFSGSLQATPGSAAAVGNALIERQALALGADAAAINPDGYSYSAQVCTDSSLIVYAINVFIAPTPTS